MHFHESLLPPGYFFEKAPDLSRLAASFSPQGALMQMASGEGTAFVQSVAEVERLKKTIIVCDGSYPYRDKQEQLARLASLRFLMASGFKLYVSQPQGLVLIDNSKQLQSLITVMPLVSDDVISAQMVGELRLAIDECVLLNVDGMRRLVHSLKAEPRDVFTKGRLPYKLIKKMGGIARLRVIYPLKQITTEGDFSRKFNEIIESEPGALTGLSLNLAQEVPLELLSQLIKRGIIRFNFRHAGDYQRTIKSAPEHEALCALSEVDTYALANNPQLLKQLLASKAALSRMCLNGNYLPQAGASRPQRNWFFLENPQLEILPETLAEVLSNQQAVRILELQGTAVYNLFATHPVLANRFSSELRELKINSYDIEHLNASRVSLSVLTKLYLQEPIINEPKPGSAYANLFARCNAMQVLTLHSEQPSACCIKAAFSVKPTLPVLVLKKFRKLPADFLSLISLGANTSLTLNYKTYSTASIHCLGPDNYLSQLSVDGIRPSISDEVLSIIVHSQKLKYLHLELSEDVPEFILSLHGLTQAKPGLFSDLLSFSFSFMRVNLNRQERLSDVIDLLSMMPNLRYIDLSSIKLISEQNDEQSLIEVLQTRFPLLEINYAPCNEGVSYQAHLPTGASDHTPSPRALGGARTASEINLPKAPNTQPSQGVLYDGSINANHSSRAGERTAVQSSETTYKQAPVARFIGYFAKPPHVCQSQYGVSPNTWSAPYTGQVAFTREAVSKDTLLPRSVCHSATLPDTSKLNSEKQYVLFSYQVELSSGYNRLRNINPFDELVGEVRLSNNDALTASRCERTGNFYLCNNSDDLKTVTVSYLIEVKPQATLNCQNPDEEKILALAEQVAAFDLRETPLTTIEGETNGERMQRVFDEAQGNCQDRVLAFCYQFNQLPLAGDYQVISEKSSSHTWVRIRRPDGCFLAAMDLGGHPAQTVYQNLEQEATLLSAEVSATVSNMCLITIENSCELDVATLDEHRGQSLLLSGSKHDVDAMIALLSPDKSTVVIDNVALLNTQRQVLKGESGQGWSITKSLRNLLHLAQEQHQGRALRLVFDWRGFSSKKMMCVNSLISRQGNDVRLGGLKLSLQTTVVSLCPKGHLFLQDRSFVKRHDRVATLPTMPVALTPAKDHERRVVSIDCYGLSNWARRLLGYPSFDGAGEALWVDGELVSACKQNNVQINVINPPSDVAFRRLVKRLQAGGVYHTMQGAISLPANSSLSLVDTPNQRMHIKDCQVFAIDSQSQLPDVYVLSGVLFERLLSNECVEHISSRLQRLAGLIEAHQRGQLSLGLTDALDETQYRVLLAECEKYQVQLKLYFYPGVAIADELKLYEQPSPPRLIKAVTSLPLAYWHHTDDTSTTAHHLKEKAGSALHVHVDELDDCAVFYQTHYQLVDGRFVFTERVSDIMQALLDGKTVILEGKVSSVLQASLASLFSPTPYIWHQNKRCAFSGTLHILSQEAPIHGVFNENVIQTQQVALDAELEEKALIEVPFEEREQQVETLLARQPMVYIEGPFASGKSHFLRSLKHHSSKSMYSLKDMQAWVENNDTKQKILVVDEMNLHGSHFSMFKGLFDTPPSIFFNGRSYPLSDKHKVIFASNPKEYSSHRIRPAILDKINTPLHFGALPNAVIQNKILKPMAIKLGLDENTALRVSGELIKSQPQAMRNIRELKAQLMLTAQDTVATRDFNPPRIDIRHYCVTESRQRPQQLLLNCLALRKLRANNPEVSGGFYGLLIDGPPRIGKTALIYHALLALGFKEEQDFVVLSREMDDVAKIACLTHAFNRGQIVIFDEINCEMSPKLQALVHAVMTGFTPAGEEAQKPGFMLFATMNAASLSGRQVLGPALKSRFYQHSLPELTPTEYAQVLARRFPDLSNVQQQTLLAKHLSECQAAARHAGEQPPCLSDLLTKARAVQQANASPAASLTVLPPHATAELRSQGPD